LDRRANDAPADEKTDGLPGHKLTARDNPSVMMLDDWRPPGHSPSLILWWCKLPIALPNESGRNGKGCGRQRPLDRHR